MKVLRGIAAILVGMFVGGVAVGVTENIGRLVFPPPEVMKDPESFRKLLADPEQLQQVMDELPIGSFAFVLIAWLLGAIIGGATAALAAPGGRIIHAGVIGFFILLASVGAMIIIPHPVWMRIAGLLLPLPMSLLAGKVVSLIMDSAAEPSSDS
jgi:hypothetical protein